MRTSASLFRRIEPVRVVHVRYGYRRGTGEYYYSGTTRGPSHQHVRRYGEILRSDLYGILTPCADVGADENITMDLRYGSSLPRMYPILTCAKRGTRFTLSRDELLTLPEFVLLSLFPNGLLPDGHLSSYEGDAFQVDVSRYHTRLATD